MGRYLAGRVAQAVGVLWAAFTVSFVVLYLLPSDPVSIAADAGGAGTPVDPAAIAELQARYGLDKPVLEQYWTALTAAVRGDFGFSVVTGQPVTTAVLAALPSTAALAASAAVLALVGGSTLAFAATYTRRGWARRLLVALPPLGVAVPTFWVGLVLLQVFSFQLRIFPAFGDRGAVSLVLPAITLAIPTGAVIAQVLSTSMAATAREPFVDTARAKGASRLRVTARHVVRLSSVPALTIAGVLVGNLLAGSVVVETVFSRAGIGRLTQTSVLSQDIPVVQGIVIVVAVVYVVVNLVVDLIYPVVDPRIVGTGGAGETEPAGEEESDDRARSRRRPVTRA